jgi:ribosomal protein RSM22 (predicted rRNA methylase)
LTGRRPARPLHEGLVGKRALVGRPYLADHRLREEYQQDIAPRTQAALAQVLAPLGPRLEQVGRVLDLGAGTGAAGAAVREALGRPLEVVAVDRVNAQPGAGVVLADLRQPGRPRGVEGRFDLIVAAHLLNELDLTIEQRAALVFSWAHDLLAPGGLVVLVEPALRETSRDLLAVRDRLVSAGYFVLAPCFLQGPCPALARERDWCHASAPWLPDQAALRAGRSRVDYSYLVLARRGGPDAEVTDRRLFRVVSDAIVDKGRLRLVGCGPAGRHQLVRLDRARAEANQDFDQAGRGDVLVVADSERAGDGLRISETTRVEKR